MSGFLSTQERSAKLWCEKMSLTKYGRWLFLFAQQVPLEAALAKGVNSFVALAKALK
jgi:hypothetical protein